MIQLFKTQRNYGGTILLIFLILLQASRFLFLFVAGYEFKLIDLNYSLLSFLVNTSIIYGCGLLLNNIANRYHFFETASNLPAAIFFIFCAFIPTNQNIGIWLIPLVVSILILNKLIKAYQKERPGRNYFDSAFLIALMTVFHPQLGLLLLALALSVFVLSMPNLSYFKVILIGFLLPFIIGLALLSFFNDLSLLQQIKNSILKELTSLSTLHLRVLKVPVFISLLIFLLSYFYWQSKKPYLSNYQTPILQTISVFAFIGLLIIGLFLPLQLESLISMACFISLLFSFFLFNNKSILANVLFTLFLIYGFLYPWIKDLNFNL